MQLICQSQIEQQISKKIISFNPLRIPKEKKIAIKIQALFRGYRDRSKFSSMKLQHLLLQRMNKEVKENAFIVIIQSWVRRFLVRLTFYHKKQISSIIVIQKHARGYRSRMDILRSIIQVCKCNKLFVSISKFNLKSVAFKKLQRYSLYTKATFKIQVSLLIDYHHVVIIRMAS